MQAKSTSELDREFDSAAARILDVLRDEAVAYCHSVEPEKVHAVMVERIRASRVLGDIRYRIDRIADDTDLNFLTAASVSARIRKAREEERHSDADE